jgi:hypothetical protein
LLETVVLLGDELPELQVLLGSTHLCGGPDSCNLRILSVTSKLTP